MHAIVGSDEVSTILHTIRLTGPWEFQVASCAGEWRTFKLPMQWREIVLSLGRDQSQTELLARRRFQRPTGLDAGIRVWLVVVDIASVALMLRINDVEVPLAGGEQETATAFDITDSLQASNVVTVEFDIDPLISDDAMDSTFDGALIEIRAAGNAAE